MTDTATVQTLRWRPAVGFAARLRLIRLDYAERIGRRVSQGDFAKLLGVKAGTYGGWEAGVSRPADLVETAQTIYRITGADPAWLLCIADDNDGPETGPGLGISASTCRDELAGRRVRHIEEARRDRAPHNRVA